MRTLLVDPTGEHSNAPVTGKAPAAVVVAGRQARVWAWGWA